MMMKWKTQGQQLKRKKHHGDFYFATHTHNCYLSNLSTWPLAPPTSWKLLF